jgi:hypothetical protein
MAVGGKKREHLMEEADSSLAEHSATYQISPSLSQIEEKSGILSSPHCASSLIRI